MTTEQKTAGTTADVFRHVLDLLVQQDMESFVDMYAEDALMEYPFAHEAEGWPTRLEGRAAIKGHVQNYTDFLRIEECKDLKIHETADPEVVVAEFVMAGIVTPTGAPYEVRYIEVVRIRSGRVIHWRDYWDPTVAASLAPGGLG